eukprot:15471637-Alexandrium_andersonii.AAC.1
MQDMQAAQMAFMRASAAPSPLGKAGMAALHLGTQALHEPPSPAPTIPVPVPTLPVAGLDGIPEVAIGAEAGEPGGAAPGRLIITT